ncbi:hypothetical protein HG263_02095 [Pseudoalteromonas sp. JBTF-M23]|uniref:Uncharacterized protein n=1 Tax=Pseudoalteromonas caenipelagi TaxID=2726988 RepID=A0A849V726_9GAMM|nr:hypothetical protein [Pseudoalteromonas caenipelagi]NOU49339.1 hypothetical protein [Pseudoalteromonas caenipelagi]
MKYIKEILFLTSLAFVPEAYAACTQNGNSLPKLVGLDGSDGKVYADIESSGNECNCKYVRFLPENTDTNKALSILLAAKMANKKVRIDLSTSENCNSAYRVYIH